MSVELYGSMGLIELGLLPIFELSLSLDSNFQNVFLLMQQGYITYQHEIILILLNIIGLVESDSGLPVFFGSHFFIGL